MGTFVPRFMNVAWRCPVCGCWPTAEHWRCQLREISSRAIGRDLDNPPAHASAPSAFASAPGSTAEPTGAARDAPAALLSARRSNTRCARAAAHPPSELGPAAAVLAELRDRVRAVELEREAERTRTGHRVLGRRAVLAQSWRDPRAPRRRFYSFVRRNLVQVFSSVCSHLDQKQR
jgi:hypothetical protein